MNLEKFFDNIKNKTIGFCGIARTNLPLIELFYNKGAKIIARDRNENLSDEFKDLFKKCQVNTILGEKYLENINEDILFRAPGVPFLKDEFQNAIKNGVAVTSEMEMFFELCPCKIYSVTGSDGKTTTTTVISEILKEDGKTVHLGGNIGSPLFHKIEEIKADDVAVIELSSFQLISMRKSPSVAVITNLAPNHLDVHKDMNEYVDAKKNIILHQNAFSKSVLNLDNKITADLAPLVRGQLYNFSRKEEIVNGAYAKDGKIFINNEFLMNTSDIKIEGEHNVENYLAAICAVFGDVKNESIIKIAKTFGGVEHRTEFVREFDGVKYYNDSIASSPSRAMSGTLSLYKEKIIMIMGGADKGVPFDEVGSILCDKVKTLILLEPEYKEGFKKSAVPLIYDGVVNSENYKEENLQIIKVKTMEEAVLTAKKIAKTGDRVSLCPACTAFDMYKSFEFRGRHFKQLVNELE